MDLEWFQETGINAECAIVAFGTIFVLSDESQDFDEQAGSLELRMSLFLLVHGEKRLLFNSKKLTKPENYHERLNNLIESK